MEGGVERYEGPPPELGAVARCGDCMCAVRIGTRVVRVGRGGEEWGRNDVEKVFGRCTEGGGCGGARGGGGAEECWHWCVDAERVGDLGEFVGRQG